MVGVSSRALPTSPRCGNVLPSEQMYRESLPHSQRWGWDGMRVGWEWGRDEDGDGVGMGTRIGTGQGQGQPCHTPRTEEWGWDGNGDNPTIQVRDGDGDNGGGWVLLLSHGRSHGPFVPVP